MSLMSRARAPASYMRTCTREHGFTITCVSRILKLYNYNYYVSHIPHSGKFSRPIIFAVFADTDITIDREIFAFFFFRVINFRVFNFRHRPKRRKLNARKLHVPSARAKFSRVKFSPPARAAKFFTANISLSTVYS